MKIYKHDLGTFKKKKCSSKCFKVTNKKDTSVLRHNLSCTINEEDDKTSWLVQARSTLDINPNQSCIRVFTHTHTHLFTHKQNYNAL